MNVFQRIFKIIDRLRLINRKIDLIHEALGRIENRQLSKISSNQIQDFEFRVFSQWGEDGIIQHILRHVPIENKIFVEFGVENYTESNTRFLLINNNWSGLVMDGSKKNINYIKNDMSVSWGHNLTAECVFITTDNINEVILRNGISGDIGLLSVDIDGNDYWVWEAITCINPRIVICEYNSLFGPHAKVSTPYKVDFDRLTAHYSNIYYGSSIAALEFLGKKKGYSLVGSNSVGNNLFFVRNDLCGGLKVVSAENAYMKAQFREAKDKDGKLAFIDFADRLKVIYDLDVVNVENNNLIKIKDI